MHHFKKIIRKTLSKPSEGQYVGSNNKHVYRYSLAILPVLLLPCPLRPNPLVLCFITCSFFTLYQGRTFNLSSPSVMYLLICWHQWSRDGQESRWCALNEVYRAVPQVLHRPFSLLDSWPTHMHHTPPGSSFSGHSPVWAKTLTYPFPLPPAIDHSVAVQGDFSCLPPCQSGQL